MLSQSVGGQIYLYFNSGSVYDTSKASAKLSLGPLCVTCDESILTSGFHYVAR